MAHQWKAGDLARCIHVGKHWSKYPIVVGRAYRVIWAGKSAEGPVALQVSGADQEQGGCWDAAWFRPILPAEPQFVEAMRSLKPRVEA